MMVHLGLVEDGQGVNSRALVQHSGMIEHLIVFCLCQSRILRWSDELRRKNGAYELECMVGQGHLGKTGRFHVDSCRSKREVCGGFFGILGASGDV